MLEFNLGNYIRTSTDLNVKAIYKILKEKNIVSYSYGNFSKKLIEDSLTAKELIYLSILLELDLNKLKEIIGRAENIGSIKKERKVGKIITSENIQSVISLVVDKLELSEAAFQHANYFSEKIDAKSDDLYTIVWDAQDDIALLVQSSDDLSSGQVLIFHNGLDNLYGEMGLNWNVEKEKKSIGQSLLQDVYAEYETLKNLNILQKPIIEFTLDQ